ncbi:hypothetical protein DPMN_119996 [Dreissena polymorpha]|uniref:Uncharacterized protein n=1 Tax=Dreissena polymorpha TaxID=45954 RepID=A0A9D4JRS6_DREPO|nr:hypothetical protein DPMN_119996 [Dreissena polymorpha]
MNCATCVYNDLTDAALVTKATCCVIVSAMRTLSLSMLWFIRSRRCFSTSGFRTCEVKKIVFYNR